MHDWGGVGLAFAQRFPERIERIVMFSTVPAHARLPLAPGGAGLAHALLGELLMGFTTRWGLRRELPREVADAAWESFDHGTQRAILKLYRSAPPEVLARAGERLGDVRSPALILWPRDDPYMPRSSAGGTPRRSAARSTLELVEGGHWSWHARPELVERAGEFLLP